MSFLSLSFALWFLRLSSLRARYFLLARTITDINQNSDYAFLRIAIYTFGTLRMTCSHSHPHKWPIKWALARILRGRSERNVSFTSLFSPLPHPSLQVKTIVAPALQTSPSPPHRWASGYQDWIRNSEKEQERQHNVVLLPPVPILLPILFRFWFLFLFCGFWIPIP